MSEIQIQAEVITHFWNNYPQTRGLLFHVPNGGKRSNGALLKAAGVVPGVPDLFFLWQGVFNPIEMKKPGGTVSPEQKDIHRLWLSNGVGVAVFWSAKHAIDYIESIIGAEILARWRAENLQKIKTDI